MTPIGDDAEYRDALEIDVGFDLHDVADLRVRGEQAALDDAAWLARSAARHVQVPSGHALVSSISIRRDIGGQT